MDLQAGQNLGKYRIERVLGRGGMGAVYLARDPDLARQVAIKVMHREFAQQHDFRQRFMQEARSAARLDHPGIVKVHTVEETEGTLYIVMEFIQGDNLQQMLERLYQQGRWLLTTEAIELIIQLAIALDYAHRQGVLHRDIKPANIMIKFDSERPGQMQPVITDLGLAKLSDSGLVSLPNTTMGTPAYMSPEQALGEETDARSDVYSLGVLLYELSVGQRPFPIRSLTEALKYHVHTPPQPPRIVRPDLPLALELVILQAMEKSPDRRFASAREMARALERIPRSELPATAPATAPGGTHSIVVEAQNSIAAQHSAQEQVTSAVSANRILAKGPDGQVISHPIRSHTITIGREPGNELILAGHRVSRRHARLEFDGTNWRVIDLNSTNGTYLGQQKLLPAVPEIWRLGVPLRIGNFTLSLGRSSRSASEVPSQPGVAPTPGYPVPAGDHTLAQSLPPEIQHRMPPVRDSVPPPQRAPSTPPLQEPPSDQRAAPQQRAAPPGGIPPYQGPLPPGIAASPAQPVPPYVHATPQPRGVQPFQAAPPASNEPPVYALPSQPPQKPSRKVHPLISAGLALMLVGGIGWGAFRLNLFGFGDFFSGGGSSPSSTSSSTASGGGVAPPVITPTPTPTSTPTEIPTATPTGTPLPTGTPTPTPSATTTPTRTPVPVVQLPDLRVASVDFETGTKRIRECYDFLTITALITVVNEGDAAIDSFYIAVNGEETRVNRRLGPGDSTIIVIEDTSSQVNIELDPAGDIEEQNENNNSRSELGPIPTEVFVCTPTLTATATATERPASTHTPTSTPTLAPPVSAVGPRRIAWVRGNPGNTDIYAGDLEADQIFPFVFDKSCDEAEPAWANGGELLVYQSNCAGSYDIYLAEMPVGGGGSRRQLTFTSDFDEREPSFSPDGTRIVYRRSPRGQSRDDDGELWTMQIDGSGASPLGIMGRAPVWSPNGRMLAFMSERSGQWNIYVYNFQSGETTLMTPNCATHCRWPDWSPRGTYLAYSTTVSRTDMGSNEIWFLELESRTSELFLSGGVGRPTWSADGYIAFNSGRGLEYAYYDGRDERGVIAEDSLNWAPDLSR